MAKRVGFSGAHLDLDQIAAHHQDLGSSLALYFSSGSPTYAIRFIGYAPSEVSEELGARLDETDLTSSLTVLGSVEAAFRIDYLQRCYRRGRDPISRAFRKIYQAKQARASLEDEIFAAWVDNSSGTRLIISELRGAFKFRHWLAHGRYTTPKMGRRYDFNDVFALAERNLNSFPFYESGED
jgi:hypothetical protein